MMREWGLTPPQWRELPDDDRELMLAESILVCQSCGNLKSFCSQTDVDLYPQREECFVTAVRELAIRRARSKNQQEPDTRGLHPLDGVSVWISDHDLNPDDEFFDV